MLNINDLNLSEYFILIYLNKMTEPNQANTLIKIDAVIPFIEFATHFSSAVKKQHLLSLIDKGYLIKETTIKSRDGNDLYKIAEKGVLNHG